MRKTLLICSSFLFASFSATCGSDFYKGTFAEALKIAGNEHRTVLVDFMTDWCRWCDTLDKNTYSNEKVKQLLSTRLIPIKIDAEKGEGIEIAKKFGVSGYPTILLVSPSGEEIDRMVGYVPPDPFLKTVEGYLRGENTMSALKNAADAHPNDAVAVYALANKYSERMDLKHSAELFMQYITLDPTDSLKHRVEAMFAIAMTSTRLKNDPSPLKNFADQYPEAPQTGEALGILVNFYLRQKEGEDARKAYEAYIKHSPGDAQMMNNYAWGCAGLKLNPDHAAQVAAEAVTLARNNDERAMYMDTQAATEYARGNIKTAVEIEQTAIGLLDKATPKEREEYEKALARYKDAAKGSTR